jgi:hypothetical protein
MTWQVISKSDSIVIHAQKYYFDLSFDHFLFFEKDKFSQIKAKTTK